jgi:ribosomal protein S18 acetylase RimI-like enzyme
LYVHAHQGSNHVGICQCVSCGGYTAAPEAQDWCFTKWLGISDELQGRGLGRHLLQRALLELRGAGYQHAAISTARDNYRAALFYTNLGYRVIDWTYAYGRRVD